MLKEIILQVTSSGILDQIVVQADSVPEFHEDSGG